VGDHPGRGHAQHRHGGGGGGQRHVVLVGPEGQHDEDHLQALQHNALEGHRERIGIQTGPQPTQHAGAAGRGPLLLERRELVMQRLEAAGAQDRLAQPLQAEDEQQAAHHHAQDAERERGDRGPERRRDHRQHQQRRADPGERRAPRAGRAHREHDRQRLDGLDRAGGEDREGEPDLGAAHADRLRSAADSPPARHPASPDWAAPASSGCLASTSAA
jgi:hypothetical protein